MILSKLEIFYDLEKKTRAKFLVFSYTASEQKKNYIFTYTTEVLNLKS